MMILKNNYLIKKLLKWANKKWKYFNIYKNNNNKKQRKTPGDIINLYMCANYLHDMIYSSGNIGYDRLKLIIMGHF